MNCPYCSEADTKVLESRLLDSAMRRRRECLQCSNRFTTYERAEFSLKVLKKTGKEEDFDNEKITSSIRKALAKDDGSAERLAQAVQRRILRRKVNPVRTTQVGSLVLQELKKHDKLAYLRFASVYKSFDDPKLLENEIKVMGGRK